MRQMVAAGLPKKHGHVEYNDLGLKPIVEAAGEIS
jgi:hypothetical protein